MATDQKSNFALLGKHLEDDGRRSQLLQIESRLKDHPYPPQVVLENTSICNLTCIHCHVNAGPKRTEIMTRETIDRIVDWLEPTAISTVDLTGGAPEMVPDFRYFITRLRALQPPLRIIDRCNLTILVTRGYEDLAQFLVDDAGDVLIAPNREMAARAGIAAPVASAATNTAPASMVPESKARRRDAGPRARRAKRRTASAGCVIPAASARAGDACLDRCDPATPRSLLIAAAMPRAALSPAAATRRRSILSRAYPHRRRYRGVSS